MKESSEILLASYEAVPYDSKPMYLTHPAHLAQVAALHGLSPSPVTRCRVLELGCASGGNLLPMALTMPEAEFVGIDLSPRQIEMGRRTAEKLDLSNIDLRAMDLREVRSGFADRLGVFDYIVAHGVYSWVPADVREHLLLLCKTLLAEKGVAYISYNTNPGGHYRDVVRDLMLYHVKDVKDPRLKAKKARQILDFVVSSVPQPEETHKQCLHREARILSRLSDEYLLHDHLEAESHPVYFHEFIEHAARYDLQFLAEAEFSLIEGLLPPKVRSALDEISNDLIELEQYRDFVFARRFRQTLLCRQGLEITYSPTKEVMAGAFVRALAEPVGPPQKGPEEFRKEDGVSLSTDNALVKAILRASHAALPRALSFGDLLSATKHYVRAPSEEELAAAVSGCLAECYMARLLEIMRFEPRFADKPSERPLASPLARLQAQCAGPVTNLRHRMVELPQLDRAVLRLLDGRSDREVLVEGLLELCKGGELHVQKNDQTVTDEKSLVPLLQEVLPSALLRLAQAVLLVA